MTKHLTLGSMLGLALALPSAAAPSPTHEKPRLVLQITVDQFRGDLPPRYIDRLGKGGLRYLLEEGIHYNNAHHAHANTETIVGHVTLATGAHPAAHGMIGNLWFDRTARVTTYNIEDPEVHLLTKGADVDADTEIDPTQKAATSDGRSPKAILTTTPSDELAAPLRGSNLASNWVGRIGSKLVKSPATLISAGADAMRLAAFQSGDLKLKGIPNSVDTMAPNNRFVKAINTLPFTPGIPYHVICGDRGKGGNKDQTAPVMSDGFVPCWSSHLDGAASTLIVPSNHSAHQNPEAMAEVKRILKKHAQ